MKSTPRLSNSSPRAETPQQDYDDDFSFDDDLMQEHVESKSAQYFVGEEVEVLYKGGEVYYPGKISKVRGSDCYDIGYDDGDGEENVEARLIKRKISSIKSPKTGDVISIGEAVEVNYKASGTYYTGKISRIYDDGTYDITYDDGDLQVKVDEKLIYLVKKNSEPINVGARVEANYHRKGQWFAGKITRVHSNGKYDVEYDDGDVETDVEKLNLKLR
jgi:ribosomal protein L35AE/L33A